MVEIVQRQCFVHGFAGRQRPRTFATAAVSHRFVVFDTEPTQIRDPRADASLLLPVASPDAAANPLVEFREVRFVRHETKVTHSTLKVATQFRETMRHRHAAVATCDLLDAVKTSDAGDR